MNPYLAYRTSGPSSGWTRIDILLALYDGVIERLDQAEAHRVAGDTAALTQLLSRVQVILGHLVAGVRLDINREQGMNMLRLYEFCLHEVRKPGGIGIRNIRRVLDTLRDGFETIREEAQTLERNGTIPSIEQLRMVQETA